MADKKCLRCEGSGEIADAYWTCGDPDCCGSGHAECPDCEGAGKINEKEARDGSR